MDTTKARERLDRWGPESSLMEHFNAHDAEDERIQKLTARVEQHGTWIVSIQGRIDALSKPAEPDAPKCAVCGHTLTEVRPGKHQCDFCEGDEIIKAQGKQLADLKAAIGTPEVYAGVITRVMEEELDLLRKERKDHKAKLESLTRECKGQRKRNECLERRYLPCPDCRDKTQDGVCLRCANQKLEAKLAEAEGEFSRSETRLVDACDARENAEAQLDEAREALKPFAAMHRMGSDPEEMACKRGTASDTTYLFSKDFARAAAALSPAQEPIRKWDGTTEDIARVEAEQAAEADAKPKPCLSCERVTLL